MSDLISDDMADDAIKIKVADRMRCLCSRREYCKADIMRKLMTLLGGDSDASNEILDSLLKDKYLDDMRYASAFARDKSAIAGWGSAKIRYALAAKGVERDIIDAALMEVDRGKADDRLEKLMANKYRTLKDDPQCRMKLLRFALGRGYSYDEAAATVGKLLDAER